MKNEHRIIPIIASGIRTIKKRDRFISTCCRTYALGQHWCLFYIRKC